MSDVSQGQGWWIASDGKWYPPELHPSVRPPTEAATGAGAQTAATAVSTPPAGVPDAVPAAGATSPEPERGPRFPDLFERARHANAVADTVSVRADGGSGPDDFFAPREAATATRRGRRRHR